MVQEYRRNGMRIYSELPCVCPEQYPLVERNRFSGHGFTLPVQFGTRKPLGQLLTLPFAPSLRATSHRNEFCTRGTHAFGRTGTNIVPSGLALVLCAASCVDA